MRARALAIAGAVTLAGTAVAQPGSRAPDAARGEQVYARCLACHALAYDRVGPRHCGLMGRRAGSVAGFAYSRAMTQSRITWNAKSLDRFLAAPTKAVPGTTMTYDGVPDRQARADLIAYLQIVGESPACSPGGVTRR